MKNIYVILVEPVYKGNVGAVSRIMNNFECKNLRIVGSIPEKDDYVLGVHSEEILKKAKVYNSLKEATKGLDRIISFSRRTGKLKKDDYISNQIGEYVLNSGKIKIGLVFGRETWGLTDAEASLCDIRCRISANKKFPSINLAQAVTIILYEIYRNYTHKSNEQTQLTSIEKLNNSATKIQITSAVNYSIEVLESMNYFSSETDKQATIGYLSKLMYKANSTKQMTLDLKKIFNRIHLKFHGKGKGFKH
jgi:tRNA/rRNA methyltransferase